MSQETSREQPTRCGLKDTFGSNLMNEADSQIEAPWAKFFAEILTVDIGAGSVRRIGSGS